jgi:hypothetical protein
MAVNGAEIAAISAGAAVLGAVVGGSVQLLVVWRQQVHERAERRRAQKQEVYREFLRLISGMPDLVARAMETDPDAVESLVRKEFTQNFDRLRADLSLVATRDVLDHVLNLWIACNKAFDDYRPQPEGPEDAPRTFGDLFADDAAELFDVTAEAMAKDADAV